MVSFIESAVLTELREEYPGQIAESITSLPDALSCIYAATGRKFVVIIDEWDALIRDEAANQEVQEE